MDNDGGRGTGHKTGAIVFRWASQVLIKLENRLVLRLLSVRLIDRDKRYWVGRPMEPTHDRYLTNLPNRWMAGLAPASLPPSSDGPAGTVTKFCRGCS